MSVLMNRLRGGADRDDRPGRAAPRDDGRRAGARPRARRSARSRSASSPISPSGRSTASSTRASPTRSRRSRSGAAAARALLVNGETVVRDGELTRVREAGRRSRRRPAASASPRSRADLASRGLPDASPRRLQQAPDAVARHRSVPWVDPDRIADGVREGGGHRVVGRLAHRLRAERTGVDGVGELAPR